MSFSKNKSGKTREGNVNQLGAKPFDPSQNRPQLIDSVDLRTQRGIITVDPDCNEFRIKKGKALMIVVGSVDSEEVEIKGNENDMKNFKNLLTRMGFEVDVLENSHNQQKRNKPTYSTFKDTVTSTITDWSNNKDGILDNVDCLVVVFLAHGGQDKVTKEEFITIGYDCILTKWVYESFANNRCKALLGKPKLFFLRHCRGSRVDYGTEAVYNTNKVQSDTIKHTTIANMAEFFIAQPSFEGYKTFMSDEGSLFVNILVEVFEEMIPKDEELHHLMLEIHGRIQREYYLQGKKDCTNLIKEAPCFKSSITKKVYFMFEHS